MNIEQTLDTNHQLRLKPDNVLFW